MVNCGIWLNSLFNSQTFAAFLGAFSAFIFGLIAYIYDKKRERIIKHENATVEFGYLLNEHLDDIWRNIYLIDGTLKIFNKNKPTYNHLNFLRNVEDIELRLGDLELINLSFAYKNTITRINHDFYSFNRAVDLLNTAMINKSLSQSDLRLNLDHLSEQLEVIKKILFKTHNQTKLLYAYIRVYQDITFNKWVIKYWQDLENSRPKITDKSVKKELKVLEDEIKNTMKESKEEIEEALGINI